MVAILLAHALATLVAAPLVRVLGRNAFLVLALAPLSGLAWVVANFRHEHTAEIAWVPGLSMDLVLRFDALAAIMSVLVLGVGALVLVYCARYFRDDSPRLQGFATQFTAFAGVMFGLVVSDNMLVLYTFWEATTVLSFLLVGYKAEKATSRRAATQALLVTTFGGLAMLVGMVILGELAGSYLLSDVLAAPPTGWLASVAVVLVLVGALSKSAIVPMHFWLPGAMAAPTPVSAYLHAAAMVKAGIYLVARLAPGFADSGPWRVTILSLGLLSMILAGWRALREFDLKLILAFGTVSQLGFLMVLAGLGTRDAALAAMTMLVAHACFKATLFLLVGIIDKATGTRDVRKLSGLGKKAPILAGIGIAGAASMAGLPVFLGFVGKKAAFAAALTDPVMGTAAATTVLALLVVGSVFTVAYSLRFVSGAFADKGGGQPSPAVAQMQRPSALFVASPVFLATAGLVAGVASPQLEGLLTPYSKTLQANGAEDYHLGLWHGFGVPLYLTFLVVGAGTAVFVAHRRVSKLRFQHPPLGNADRVYDATLRLADTVSQKVTGTTQRGSLPTTQSVILATLVAAPIAALAWWHGGPFTFILIDSPLQLALGVVMVAAALGATVMRNRLAGVLLIGLTGYGMGAVFAFHGAPDLALTQVLVETLTLVVFVLVLRKLPAESPPAHTRAIRLVRAGIAVSCGAMLTVVGVFAMSARTTVPVSAEFPNAAYYLGDGANIVNVTLVDIRAWDTMGEISVLLVAATGVASLIFRNRRFGAAPRVSDVPGHTTPPPRVRRLLTTTLEGSSAPEERAKEEADTALHAEPAKRHASYTEIMWLRGTELRDPRDRSLILEVTTRLMFPTMMVLSLYFFFAGHNAPGGGFAGGLVAGLALVLRYIAGGRYEIGEAVPVDAGKLLGAGLVFAVGSALTSILLGAPALSSATFHLTLPLLGDIKFVTALFFDLGVYLIVVGLVLDVLRSLGARLDSQIEVTRQ